NSEAYCAALQPTAHYGLRPNAPYKQLMQTELAVDRADFDGTDEARMRHRHRVQRAVERALPEAEEFLQQGKLRPQIVVLPHVGLQQPAIIGAAVEDARGGQAIALELAAEIFRDHGPALRAASCRP